MRGENNAKRITLYPRQPITWPLAAAGGYFRPATRRRAARSAQDI
jgi:hypothetical protein